MFQNGVNEYNDTTQNVYKNSITILSYDSYYDVDNRELVILAVIINNRSKPISNIEFDGDMQITIDPKAKVVPNGFELSSENYDPIKPREGTIIPMTFRVLNYTKDVITFNKKEITGSLYNFKFKELDNKKIKKELKKWHKHIWTGTPGKTKEPTEKEKTKPKVALVSMLQKRSKLTKQKWNPPSLNLWRNWKPLITKL
ncbi:hypothetical protein [Listeria grayi]|uniref:Uncharacterized protein n=1 Tax=Listeria grayi FSL F6-1183 TaxID=1265827 RepID=A0A829R4F9_LISGR|nr:hypothetical protein [Listeria grayi]EUJ27235.1 hypothetical protein LMUR_10362 [Listeria grayi FSL F6-1183]